MTADHPAADQPPVATRKRNPSWARDELILALDLYLREGQLDAADPSVIELSAVLNALPIHTDRPDREKFRNPNGVAMKLANFAALDPGYPGVGLDAGGQGDRDVWDYFSSRPGLLTPLVARLRAGADSDYRFPVGEEEGEDEVPEGRLPYRQHRVRERKPSIANRRKAVELAKHGVLACSVCDFNFAAVYGELGQGYVECHHVVPLSHAGETATKLTDLALVCANCHRMLHSRIGWTTPSSLRAVVEARRASPAHE
jgi:5-methylcytosine-specific restriction protein A